MSKHRAWFDRESLLAFARHLWRRFVDDKCFETAGALSYTTLFALVPLTAAVIGILSAFPVFNTWTQQLTDFVFRSFVPAAGATVRDYLFQFAGNASKMTALGVVVLLASALMMMSAIEDRLNRIWRVEKQRSSVSRFLMYWAALTLGPILAVGGLALSSYLFALPVLNQAAHQFGLQSRVLQLLPFLLTLLMMLLLYTLVPNRRVGWRPALVGAFVAAILFEFAKWGFALYVSKVPSYQQIYGALAVVPIFLIWIYVSWVIVLLGASLAASLSSFEYRPAGERLPAGCEFLGLLHVLKHFVAAQRAGRQVTLGELAASERHVSDQALQRYLDDLHRGGLIVESEAHGWTLLRSLDHGSLLPVFELGAYRLPLDSAALVRWNAGLPPPLQALLQQLSAAVRQQLETPLARLYPFDETDGKNA